jgi:hypothetical protein
MPKLSGKWRIGIIKKNDNCNDRKNRKEKEIIDNDYIVKENVREEEGIAYIKDSNLNVMP